MIIFPRRMGKLTGTNNLSVILYRLNIHAAKLCEKYGSSQIVLNLNHHHYDVSWHELLTAEIKPLLTDQDIRSLR